MSRSEWSELVLEGFLAAEMAGDYYNVPFQMPAGVRRLEVRYEYDAEISSDRGLMGGNTLDIGIFDQRGAEFPGAGFRGWSGSARHQFFIAFDEATPGYLPGPLMPGLWHISLGFYKSAPDGCHYRVWIRFLNGQVDSPPPSFPPMLTLDNSRAALQPRESGWYRGELHCHTYHSDGDSDPRDVIAAARKLGLDYIAITDHNSISHLAAQAELIPTPIVLIPGCEVTSYKGHWNVWGLESWLDFRTLTPELMRQSIDQAIHLGYLVSCNHPRNDDWVFRELRGQHCLEVWNGPWALLNSQSLDYWESRLRTGERLVAVGGSDAHFLLQPHVAHLGIPTTWIYCRETPTAHTLLVGLRAGHVFISDAPDGPQLHLQSGEAMMGDIVSRPTTGWLSVQVRTIDSAGLRLELHGARGLLAQTEIVSEDSIDNLQIPVNDTPYVRAQLLETDTNPSTMKALSNPIYIE